MFLDYFNNKLLEAEIEIEKDVYNNALRSYNNRKHKDKKPRLKVVNIFEVPSLIRDLGIKIKHFKPYEDRIEIQLFDADSVLKVTKFLKANNLKFNVDEDNLKVTIKG